MKTSDYRKAYEKRKRSREWKRAWGSELGIITLMFAGFVASAGIGALAAFIANT